MSFFNFGPSPTKSSDAANFGAGNGDFNMFGGGATVGAGSFFGGVAEPVDSSSGGSFFGADPGTAEAGGSMFGSTRQPEDASTGNARTGQPDISPPTPAKMTKPDPAQSQAMSSTAPTNPWGAATPSTAARPTPSPSAAWGHPPPSSTGGPRPSPSVACAPPPQGDTRSQSYGQSQNPQQGRPVCEAPSSSMSNQKPPVQSYSSTESCHSYQPAPADSNHVSDNSAQGSALREKTGNDTKKDEDDEGSAEALLRDMIDMQKQQLYNLVPKMKRSEEMSEQILTSTSLVLRDVTNYGEKLSVTKQLYCSRLSQVSSFLRMVHKTEK